MIYICIPSHNEERTVGILLWKIRQVLTAFPRDYQLLVLDDASTDRTTEVLAPYARILPLTVLRHAQRRGYAASLDELLREAVKRSEYPRRDVILTLQADFTEDPDEIPTLLKRIESGADIVTTRAAIAPEHAPRKLRWLRALSGRLLRRLNWPETVTDMVSGMRAYRVIGVKKALEERGNSRLSEWADAWAANAALLRAVTGYVRRVDEVPVALRPDRRQRDSRLDAWANARALVRMAFNRPPRYATPARRAPATIVSERELTAAARPAPPPPAPEPPRRGRRPGRERQPAATGDAPARKRTRSGAREAGERPPKAERAERAERGERGEKTRAAAGERAARPVRGEAKERAEVAAAGEQGRRSRAEREPAVERPADSTLPGEQGVPAGRSRRGRRGRGAAAAVAGEEAPGVSQPMESESADAMPADGGLAEVLDADLIESLDALTPGQGAEAGAGAGRKSRRRRSSRRRSRRGGEPAATEATAEPASDLLQGPADPGNADAAPAAWAVGGGGVAGPEGDGEAGGPAGEGAAEGAPRRRRSRRGGRGRSRGRRAVGSAQPTAEAADAGDTGESPSSYGDTPAPAPSESPTPAVPEPTTAPAPDGYRPPPTRETVAPPPLLAAPAEPLRALPAPRQPEPPAGTDETTRTD